MVTIAAFFVFLVVAITSTRLAFRSGGFKTLDLSKKQITLLNFSGFLSTVILATILMWSVPTKSSTDYTAYSYKFGIVIFFPLVFGISLTILGSLFKNLKTYLTPIAAGSLLASTFTPLIAPLASSGYTYVQHMSALNIICKDSHVEIIQKIEQAKSAAFFPGHYIEPASNHQTSKIMDSSEFLLNNSLIESIERPATYQSGLKNQSQYERVKVLKNKTPDGGTEKNLCTSQSKKYRRNI